MSGLRPELRAELDKVRLRLKIRLRLWRLGKLDVSQEEDAKMRLIDHRTRRSAKVKNIKATRMHRTRSMALKARHKRERELWERFYRKHYREAQWVLRHRNEASPRGELARLTREAVMNKQRNTKRHAYQLRIIKGYLAEERFEALKEAA